MRKSTAENHKFICQRSNHLVSIYNTRIHYVDLSDMYHPTSTEYSTLLTTVAIIKY